MRFKKFIFGFLTPIIPSIVIATTATTNINNESPKVNNVLFISDEKYKTSDDYADKIMSPLVYTTKLFYINGEVDDPNGWQDIDGINATFYRGGLDESYNCPQDFHRCYKTNCFFENISQTTVKYSCPITMACYADATDSGFYQGKSWGFYIQTIDKSSEIASKNFTRKIDVTPYPETCNRNDDNCNGFIDEGTDCKLPPAPHASAGGGQNLQIEPPSQEIEKEPTKTPQQSSEKVKNIEQTSKSEQVLPKEDPEIKKLKEEVYRLAILISTFDNQLSVKKENDTNKKHQNTLTKEVKGLNIKDKKVITNFITYGSPSTYFLGSGERAGVLNSYKTTYKKLPKTEDEWLDVLKISNGRFPAEANLSSESKAINLFQNIYLRTPDLNNRRDLAAIAIIGYGVRPKNRNLNSEKVAKKIFISLYKHQPANSLDWDILRAITYSGAKR